MPYYLRMRRLILAALVCASVLLCGSVLAAAPKVIVSYALSLHGAPKYPAGFAHFDYVNPDAPRGGALRQWIMGTYDNFNQFALRGLAAAGSDSIYDTLMTGSEDEISVYYGLIAEKVEYPEDYTWIVFHINPKATAQDGAPITADDVVFSFNKFFNEGVPQFKEYYSGVAKVETLDRLSVKFTLKKGDKAMMISLAQLNIIPKKYWESRTFGEPSTDVPQGTGAYVVKDYKMGQYVVWQRSPTYWALNLPVNKGQLNFDLLRYDYFRDETVAFEAFKAGEFDLYQESIAKNWATLYTGKNFDNGAIIKEDIPHEIPQGMQAIVFNTQRPVLKDRRVRQALNFAMDFEWMNKNLFYSQYKRLRSYFTNTPYAATGLPDPEELKILNPLKGKIPDEVFATEYNPPVTDGSGEIRDQVRQALALLKDAGWEIRDQKLVNVKTGDPLVLELLMDSPSMQRVAVPVQKNLARMGITMNIRQVDSSQYVNRLRNRDFDMIAEGYGAMAYPSTDLNDTWRSNYIDSTYNTAGVQDPAIDYLVDGCVANQDNEKALLAWGHALDRVLTWNYYVIPEWYLSTFRVASWNKFSRPSVRPRYTFGLGSWWLDKDKEAKLPKK
jgi:microcin C transport system substrate-binding protein